MAQPFPYTYYSCSCVNSTPSPNVPASKRAVQHPEPEEDEEETFDPRSPRANFSLYPLEHLLYCTECHQIRCSRCITEEVVCWYCPSCLFEVPSSTVRSEGNRCTRSCYNCPICTSFLSISALEPPTEDPSNNEGPTGPFILSCPYCQWTSLDIGIKFEKPNNLTGQLQRIRNGGRIVPTPKERETQAERLLRRATKDEDIASPVERSTDGAHPDADDLFANLNTFYRSQLTDSSDMATYSGTADINFSSPSSISRLLNLYSTGKKMKRTKPKPMREALDAAEGLQVLNSSSEDEAIHRLKTVGWDGTVSFAQRQFQERHSPHFVSDLRPTATLLRTKRSKRCKTCRTLLSKPEPKVSTNRYKIKVLALNNVPKVLSRGLNTPATSLSHPLVASSAIQLQTFDYASLQPLMPQQFLLTLTNPLFDPIRVTLATSAVTPGRVQTRVTILCPRFEVGANTDVWDEALNSSASAKRKSTMPGSIASADDGGTRQPEAGKIWEKGRNWTTVIVEVIPGTLPGSTGYVSSAGDGDVDLGEDEDVCEIPVFVRLEYDTDAAAGEERVTKVSEGKERREVAFWCVLGVGRIVG